MQSRWRLKLTVLLLMASSLMGGVAFWFSQPRLTEEERRLVGKWTIESYGSFYQQEFLLHRAVI
ncbi:hypothetical protein SAMN05421753_12097 [Planctomicrobium piriforme]|uniref:Uncharacterized protein n=1 Tax=Planctomicrobium piriforme TaxID=1576369 RepID=A0A1I3RDL8_9PLAN|nr:hypothetical protein SAMN05421753_12097 [Planctomicrobium piriforme]